MIHDRMKATVMEIPIAKIVSFDIHTSPYLFDQNDKKREVMFADTIL